MPEKESGRCALGGVAFARLPERVPWGCRASYRAQCCRWRVAGALRSRSRRRPPAGRTCCRGSDATGWARWSPPGWRCCRTAQARRLPPPRSPSCRPATPRRSNRLGPLLSSAAGERIISEGAVSAPPPASPLLLALRAASPSALSWSVRRRGAGSERGRGGGGSFIWRLGREPGRRRKRRRKGPPGTSSRGGCLRSPSRWPKADVICSKSSRPRPGSWRDEVCGQWSEQGHESRGWGGSKGENTPNLPPQHTHCRLQTLTPLMQENGMDFHFQSGDIYPVRGCPSQAFALCPISDEPRFSRAMQSWG